VEVAVDALQDAIDAVHEEIEVGQLLDRGALVARGVREAEGPVHGAQGPLAQLLGGREELPRAPPDGMLLTQRQLPRRPDKVHKLWQQLGDEALRLEAQMLPQGLVHTRAVLHGAGAP